MVDLIHNEDGLMGVRKYIYIYGSTPLDSLDKEHSVFLEE
jgi:hypothetical protein